MVDAQSNIYGAGLAAPPAGSDGRVPVGVPVSGGSSLSFSVSGRVRNVGTSSSNDADGVGASTDHWCCRGAGSLSPVCAPLAGFLVGVFLGPEGNSGAALAMLDVRGGAGTSFAALSPGLRQVFFIGDGLTGQGTGAAQFFTAPQGAAMLYLGLVDNLNQGEPPDFMGPPGGFADNTGSFTVTLSVVAAVCAPKRDPCPIPTAFFWHRSILPPPPSPSFVGIVRHRSLTRVHVELTLASC